MAEKKDRGRFTLRFNENDPVHEAVISILEKQPPHSKAPFLVNAVMHYIHCPETPDMFVPGALDRAAIESVVLEILKNRGMAGSGEKKTTDVAEEPEIVKTEPYMEQKRNDAVKPVDEATMSLIADTLSAFRNN